MLATVIIPNFNGLKHLQRCLPALVKQSFQEFTILIVDNGSTDNSIGYVESHYPQIQVISLSNNTGFAHACNRGIESVRTTYTVLLNNDTEPAPTWLENLVTAIEKAEPDVAAISSLLLKMDSPHIVDDCGDYLTWQGVAFKRGHGEQKEKYSRTEEIMLPCAGAALYRTHVIKDLRAFDELYFAYLEDVDLGLRMRLCGHRCLFEPTAEVLHVGHGSSIETDRYVYLTTRNRILTLLKNIPLFLLFKRLPQIVYGHVFFAVVHRGKWVYWRATLSVLKHLKHILEARKFLQPKIKLDTYNIDELLNQPWPEVGVLTLLRREFQRIQESLAHKWNK